jgi:3-oxoacyl-[acyl-carrier-protein] synthase III
MRGRPPDLVAHLLRRLRQVQSALGQTPLAEDAQVSFADAVDSMGLVEFVGLLASDWGVAPEDIERAAGHSFGTVAQLAAALEGAGLRPSLPAPIPQGQTGERSETAAWLAATAARLPACRQRAEEINAALGRPAGWLEQHAGIVERRVWADEDPLGEAGRAARDCLERAGVGVNEVGALLVTSEAPPVVGLAAALHARLGLGAGCVPLEVGGACTGFLAALWAARWLLAGAGAALVVAVEAHSRWLPLRPGPAGESAALFGDGAAACLLSAGPTGPGALPLGEVRLGSDGAANGLVALRPGPDAGPELHLGGPALAGRAVHTLAGEVRGLARPAGLRPGDLGAVVIHGGNGRMPALVARALAVPEDRVWSETPRTGNLGSASLPVAWAARRAPAGPVAWAAVGAGLLWGAVLLGVDQGRVQPPG